MKGDKASSLGVELGTGMRVCQAWILILHPCPGLLSSLSGGALAGITIRILTLMALSTGLGCLHQKCQMVKRGVGYGVWPVGARPGGVLLAMVLSHVRGMGNSQGFGYCPGIDMGSGCTEVQGRWGFRPSKDPIYEATASTSEGKLAAEPSSSK